MLVKQFIYIIFCVLFFVSCNQQAKDKSIKEFAFAEKIKTDNLHGLGPFILTAVELKL